MILNTTDVLERGYVRAMTSTQPLTSSWVGPHPPGTPTPAPRLEGSMVHFPRHLPLFCLRGGKSGGPPVLFIHGIGGWAEHWLPTLGAFSAHEWVIPDLPGFGRSSPPSAATGEVFVESLIRLLDHLHVDRAILVGNSLGGGLALRLAFCHPDRVSVIILANAAGILRDISPAFQIARWAPLGRLLLSNRFGLMGLRWRSQMGNRRIVSEQFLREVADFSVRYDCRPTYLELLRRGLDRHGQVELVMEQLPHIRHPVLLSWGTKDRVLPYHHGVYAASVLPDVQFETFEGAGHYPHWEAPERFNHLVQQFLKLKEASWNLA